MTFRRIATRDELWDGEMLGRTVDGVRVLLVGVDGEVRAYLDRCAHRGLPLSDGTFERGTLTCRLHLWCYDARTGHGINPRSVMLRPLPVRLEGDDILVSVEEAS
jgi:toluene monooxygenase system ferredoxin subunit